MSNHHCNSAAHSFPSAIFFSRYLVRVLPITAIALAAPHLRASVYESTGALGNLVAETTTITINTGTTPPELTVEGQPAYSGRKRAQRAKQFRSLSRTSQ